MTTYQHHLTFALIGFGLFIIHCCVIVFNKRLFKSEMGYAKYVLGFVSIYLIFTFIGWITDPSF
jgi:hypothetical protein